MSKKIKSLNKILKIPFKKTHSEAILPQFIKKGDAGADARIIGFKKININGNSKELIDLQTDSYKLKPFERI
ncbi:MAG: hypothetical protein ACFE9R_19745, partial [Candidatus Hermodarchaeota archaeon]